MVLAIVSWITGLTEVAIAALLGLKEIAIAALGLAVVMQQLAALWDGELA
jgi:hypothetical protein